MGSRLQTWALRDFGETGRSRISKENAYRLYVKRAIDLALVLLTLPSTLLIASALYLIVKIDRGPALYSQLRIGRDGRTFRMWKFRTMVPNADSRLAELLTQDPELKAEWDYYQKLKIDPRITRVGRWMRRSSLDEIPQIWNVLVGDMSLIGPRPMLTQQQLLYPGEYYTKMRPGLTGLWQVSDRNEVNFATRAVYDKQYFHSMSFYLDAKILISTVKVVLRATGR